MKISTTTKIGAVLASSMVVAASSALAQSTPFTQTFDVSNNGLNGSSKIGLSYTPTIGTEFGNEVLSYASGYATTIDSLSYEYSGAAASVNLNIYENDGPVTQGQVSPGTLLYSSGAFAVAASPTGTTLRYSALDVVVPAGHNFTWTVTFTGASGAVGLDFYGPPSGTFQMINGIVQANGTGGWQYEQGVGTSYSTFGSLITGTVPEPSTYALAGLGLAALAFAKFGKRKTA
jgi:hypothetical protein